MVTIEDVAARANVSRMTVSRVINKKGYVKEETMKRVQQAIRDLNYKPNLLAKALVTRRHRVIAYVMVNISDPFHNLVKQGFESIAYHSQFVSMMCDVHSAERQHDYLNSFQENCISGVVFHHLAITEECANSLEQVGIRCVMLDNEYDMPNISSVNTDNYGGAKMAAKHLYERGHRRIGCVHGILGPSRNSEVPLLFEDTFQFHIWQQRTAGFTDAMAELGLTPAGFFQSNGRADTAEMYAGKIVQHILEDRNRPTALYCENDIMALSVMKRLQENGIRIPHDIAVVGHDGLEITQMLHPQLTTIRQPRYEMGRTTAQILIDEIENNTAPRHIVLEPSLLIGETT